jgi:hypothetical protein
MKINKGDKVTYTSEHGTKSIGVVKSDVSPMEEFIPVVFNCGNDWDNYDDCSPVLVETRRIHPEWDADAVLKHYDVKLNVNEHDD